VTGESSGLPDPDPDDGVTFQLLTDPFQDVRYPVVEGSVPQGPNPSSDQVLATVGQVIRRMVARNVGARQPAGRG